MMDRVQVLLLFLISLCVASKQLSNFNFKNDLERLKILLKSDGDIRPVLNSFNSDTRQFFVSSMTPSSEAIHEYISIKEEIICLLLNYSSIKFFICEFDAFNESLLLEILRYKSYFSRENLHLILIFLFKTSNKNSVKLAQKVALKLLKDLTPEQLNTFANSGLFNYDQSDSDFDEKIRNLSISSDPEVIFSIFCQILNEKLIISPSSHQILADLLKLFDFHLHPDWLIPIIDTLNYLFLNGIKSSNFTNTVGDFIFSESLVNTFKDMEINESYSLILYFISKEPQIFNNKLSIEIQQALNQYSNVFFMVNKIYKCFQMINNLNEASNEFALKLAIGAIGNFLRLKHENEFVRQVLIAESESMIQSVNNVSSIYSNELNPLNLLAWKIIGLIGYLCHDLTEKENSISICLSNIVTGLGHVLLKEDINSISSSNVSIDHLSLIISKTADATLANIKKYKTPVKYSHLQAIIKFIELHPLIKERNSLVDQFCLQYISDVSSQFNKYFSINNLEITDKHAVYVSSFLTFLESYVLNPSEAKLPYLREFYLFLKDSELLSKTELIFLNDYFKGFRKLGRR